MRQTCGVDALDALALLLLVQGAQGIVQTRCRGALAFSRLLLLLLSLLLLRMYILTLSSLTRFPFHDSQVSCWSVFGSKMALRGFKSDLRRFLSAPRATKSAPRGRQEAF